MKPITALPVEAVPKEPATVSSNGWSETLSVSAVNPAPPAIPTAFYAQAQYQYNPGATLQVSFIVPQPDASNPGPQTLWNTRDHHPPRPVAFWSVID